MQLGVSTLTAILTHVRAGEVHESLGLLRKVAPAARYVVCYGGPIGEFEQIESDHKLFINDATLRGPERHLQSLTAIFQAVWSAYFEADGSVDSLYMIEYDHLILDPRFETRLRELAARTRADLLGKNCVDCTATNEAQYVRFRSDARLIAHLRSVSVRDDPTRLFRCLGDGMWISRDALGAYVVAGEHPPCYCEVYVPTLLHHLGFRVVDVDAHSDLYLDVRWLPRFDTEQAMARFADGAAFIHPVKDPVALRAISDALAPAPQSRLAISSHPASVSSSRSGTGERGSDEPRSGEQRREFSA